VSEVLAKRVFIFSSAFLIVAVIFAYGIATVMFGIWPYQTIKSVSSAVKSLNEFGELVPEGRRVRAPVVASRQSFTIHDPERIGNGYYVYAGWDSENSLYAAWLYDAAGERRHTWLINYDALDPDGPSNKSDTPHAFHLLHDGSIIVGWDKGDIMARLDACGDPIWIKTGIYHHSLSRADDGTFWVWRSEGTAYGHYNYMENFDAGTGEAIQEVALIEDIIKGMGSTSIIFGVRPDYPFKHFQRDPQNPGEWYTMDIFHPNDVDVLGSDVAPMFPMFDAGDLLLSFRSLNLITVVDPDDYRVKWWSHGPWRAQHDPDFIANGEISVYANNTGRGRSEIIRMDPVTKEVSNDLFNGEVSFYSDFAGKHQYLPNGNVLIVVPGEGRVLEVTSEGGQVTEFNNLSSASLEYNEHVFNGMWVQSDYFKTVPVCAK